MLRHTQTVKLLAMLFESITKEVIGMGCFLHYYKLVFSFVSLLFIDSMTCIICTSWYMTASAVDEKTHNLISHAHTNKSIANKVK